VAVTLAGSDSGTLDVDQSFDQTYRATLETLKGMGEIKTENKAQGIIKAVVSKADVTARISQSTEKTTRIVVSAREMLLPKPEIAKGVVLKLSEKLK
jgi:predicted secreted protein